MLFVAEEVALTTAGEIPKFAQIIEDQMVTEGEEFSFMIKVEPQAGVTTNVSWYKNNEKVEARDRVEVCI